MKLSCCVRCCLCKETKLVEVVSHSSVKITNRGETGQREASRHRKRECPSPDSGGGLGLVSMGLIRQMPWGPQGIEDALAPESLELG